MRDPSHSGDLSTKTGQLQFTSECPDQLWVADMTEHPTAEGKVYLSAVIDYGLTDGPYAGEMRRHTEEVLAGFLKA